MGRRASRVPRQLHQVFFGGVVGLFCSLDLCPVLPDCLPDDERQMPNKETKLHILFEGTFFFFWQDVNCTEIENRLQLPPLSISFDFQRTAAPHPLTTIKSHACSMLLLCRIM